MGNRPILLGFGILVFTASFDAGAAQKEKCPPDHDWHKWTVYDVYEECDPSSGDQVGRHSGTSLKRCGDIHLKAGATEASACYKKIEACQEWVGAQNKNSIPHNAKLASCTGSSPQQPNTPDTTLRSRANHGGSSQSTHIDLSKQ